jgi:hypothetical protein
VIDQFQNGRTPISNNESTQESLWPYNGYLDYLSKIYVSVLYTRDQLNSDFGLLAGFNVIFIILIRNMAFSFPVQRSHLYWHVPHTLHNDVQDGGTDNKLSPIAYVYRSAARHRSHKDSHEHVGLILSRVWVTIHGVWIGNWIYWTLTDRNYK